MSSTCCAHQREGELAQRRRARAVGDRAAGCRTVCSTPVLNERVASSPASGSTPTTRQPGLRRRAASARAREQPAAAAGHQQQVERAGLLDQLAGRRALARDHVGVVEGRDQHGIAVRLQPARDLLAVLARRVVVDHARAVALGRRGAWRRARPSGITTVALRAQQPAGQGHRLRVVARGVGQDPAPALGVAQPRDRVVGAAELEGAHALQVLALQEQRARPQPLVERARGHDGRAVRDAFDPRGGVDVLVRDHGAASQPRRVHRVGPARVQDAVHRERHVQVRGQVEHVAFRRARPRAGRSGAGAGCGAARA